LGLSNLLELNKIYNEDCLEGMKRIPDKSIDMTVTSPPYDNLRTYNGFSWDFEGIADELYRVTKYGGVVVWIVGDGTIKGSESGTSFKQALYFKEIGFNLHDTMIWEKWSPFPDKTRYNQSFEYMFILSKGKPKTVNLIKDKPNKRYKEKICGTMREKDGSLRKMTGEKKKIAEFGTRLNVWKIAPVMSNSERTGHPAQFPESLIKDHITSWSNEGDTVLDAFMGSGTTAIAAINTNRNFVGFEMDETYFNIANERIAKNQTAGD